MLASCRYKGLFRTESAFKYSSLKVLKLSKTLTFGVIGKGTCSSIYSYTLHIHICTSWENICKRKGEFCPDCLKCLGDSSHLRYTGPVPHRECFIYSRIKGLQNYLNLSLLVSSTRAHVPVSIHISFISIFAVVRKISANKVVQVFF